MIIFAVLLLSFSFASSLPPGADLNSFRRLSDVIAKDNKYVYFHNEPVPGPDAKTLEVILEVTGAKWSIGYLRDAQHVYVYGDSRKPALIPGADPKTFEVLDKKTSVESYHRDKNSVFYDITPLKGAHPKSFVSMGAYGKDKSMVFYRENPIPKAHPSSFVLIPDCEGGDYHGPSYSKDKNSVFFKGKKIETADPATFQRACAENQKFDAKDKNRAYLKGLPQVDCRAFIYEEDINNSSRISGDGVI